MPTVDVTNDIGVSFEHHVFVDQAGAGNRRPSSMNGALDAVFARPRNHLMRGLAIFYAAEAHFAKILTPAAASSLKSSSTMPCSRTGAPA